MLMVICSYINFTGLFVLIPVNPGNLFIVTTFIMQIKGTF